MNQSKYIVAREAEHRPSLNVVDRLIGEYGWFMPLRVMREVITGREEPLPAIAAAWRLPSSLRRAAFGWETPLPPVQAQEGAASTLEVIDRFLQEKNLKIVAEDGEPDGDVRTDAVLSDEEELVSEELAEIYLAQGMKAQAVAIYRKLSLLNSEKSVYFAELIRKIEKK